LQQKQEVSNTNRLFQSRNQSEEEAVSMQPTRNRLHAATLSELLDARKDVRTTQDLKKLAEKYGIDKQKTEKLATFVNTPSVDGGSMTRTVEKDGDESLTTTVR
jgi:3,4-dihydroxy-2-butanone 4-phosphate synthase